MSAPNVLAPWYVVQVLVSVFTDVGDHEWELHYYTAQESDGETFTDNPKVAMLFTNLQSAVRVAEAEGAHIRVLTSEREAHEFGRG